jgi:uncharacterized protein
MANFVVSKRNSGVYKFEYTNRKGKIVFTSHAFELRMDCEALAEDLKKNIEICVFEKKKSQKGDFYFTISLHSEIVATSRKFSTELMADKCIEEINKYAPQAEILDFTTSNPDFGFE